MITLKTFDMINPFEIADFQEYVKEFYSNEREDSIYPIASESEIDKAIYEYTQSLNGHEWMEWGGGDSLDRERVREILEPEYSILIPA